MAETLSERVAVYVTRLKHNEAQLLLERPAFQQKANLSLPETGLLPGEHPAEAVWRLVRDIFDQDSCRAFHKLGQIDFDATSYHVFQAGLDEDHLEPNLPLQWLEHELAAETLAQPWRDTLAKLR